LDEVTRTGKIQSYQLAISGIGRNVNYYMSASYDDNKSIVVGDNFNRISLLAKINTKITEWLQFGMDASYSRRDYGGIAANIGDAEKMSPYGVMFRDSLGHLEKYPYTQSGVNPLWGVQDGTIDNMDVRHNFRLNSYMVIDVPWIKGLSYRMNLPYTLEKSQSGTFYHESYFIAEGEGLARYSPATVQGLLAKANGNLNTNSTYAYVFDNILNYKKDFGKHRIDATLVATRDYSKYNITYETGADFAANGNTSLGIWGLHKATTQKIDMYVNDSNINGGKVGGVERANVGYLGRLSYSFNDKYFVTGSYRRDGASVFGANKKWGNYAAAGVAWRISNEEFLKGFEPLSDLKLKFSWGQNGNQGTPPYSTLSKIANGASGGARYEFSNTLGTINYGLYQETLGNVDLGWESTDALNTGFESVWLKGRLSLNLDAYFSKTTEQFFAANIPPMTGFKTIFASMGQINNSGIEATFRSVNIQNKNLTWSTSFTFWKNWNKIVKLYGIDANHDGKEDDDIANSLFIGKSLGAIYGYKQDGIVQETDLDYIALTGSAPGSPKYKDLDGVPGITAADRTILGYDKDNFRLNMSNSLAYRNFELYMMVTGTFGGNNYFLKSNASAYTTASDRFNDNTISKPYWTPENKSNEYPSAYFAGDGRFLGLQSRGFVRIQDISLSYTFKQNWVKASKINALKLFISVKNFATFTNWTGGDPETGTPVKENTFPVPSTYLVGANINF